MDVSPTEAGLTNHNPLSGSGVSHDFETFLRMLTTQIQNQDPLNPMAADQFASQLASFSMVEQQTLTNQNLESLLSALGTGRLASHASLVGRHALHDGPFDYSGPGVEFELERAFEANNEAKLTIIDDDGSMVAELNVAAGQTRITWDGTAEDGLAASPGTYVAELRSAVDSSVVNTPVYTGDIIEEVRFDDTGTELLLANGTRVKEADVSKLR